MLGLKDLLPDKKEELGDQRHDLLILIDVGEGVYHQLGDQFIPGLLKL